MIEARRRGTFHVAGEPLVVSSSPTECVDRLAAMSAFTGLPAESLLTTPIVTTPIPCYPASWDVGRRRWAGTRPEAMWHPLMWLPKRVAHRYTLVSAAGDEAEAEQPRLEGDDAWALRVCLELSSAGLYDEETGEWLDVLSGAGLDIDDDADLARVQEWLDGAADPVLDGIDLAPLLLRDPPDWAVAEAAAWMPTMRVMVWGTHADALLEKGDVLLDAIRGGVHLDGGGRGPISLGSAKEEAALLLFFARDVFRTIDEEEGLVWALYEAEADSAEDLDGLVRVIELAQDRLRALAEMFVPVIEEAGRVIGAGVEQFAGADPAAAGDAG